MPAAPSGTHRPWSSLAVPAVLTGLMMAVLVGLGVWQLHRLAWKQRILAQIDHAEASAAVPLPLHPGPFQKVAVAGVLRPGAVVLYGADVRDTKLGPQLGGQLIEPLIRPDGVAVLVDLGWVPDRGSGRADVPAAPGGPARIEGYVRLPEHAGRFSPKDDPAMHRFYTLNPQAMAGALGLTAVAPFTLIAMGAGADDVYPAPATALPRPPNDHFGYALTWFGLALTLAGVFGAWARGAMRAGLG